jgi:dihydrofolate synthase/folylpolyglutamate synthase
MAAERPNHSPFRYEECVRFLSSLGNELKTAKYDLDRVRALLDALDNPQHRGRFVHIAGTNGKGSTSAMIESGLRTAGFSTGLYTSPHLAEPTERIRVNGQPVSREEFAALFAEVHEVAEEMIAAGRLELHPTYFETVTAMAFKRFAAGCDWTVLEVGLGGRLDATNVVMPQLCAITAVDFDHEAWLGRSLEAIAFEKAGILKPRVPAVISPQRAEAWPVIEERAKEVQAPLIPATSWQIDDLNLDRRGSRYLLSNGAERLSIVCPLAGEHQVENSRTAAIALRSIGVESRAVEQGIASVRWPGRLERVSESPEVILDGAHNPSGARALAAYIDRFYSGEPLTLIYGAMRDKAVEEVAGTLFPRFREVIVTAPRQPRALAPESFLELVDHRNIRMAPNLEAAVAQIRGTTFISGSLFLVAEARRIFVNG